LYILYYIKLFFAEKIRNKKRSTLSEDDENDVENEDEAEKEKEDPMDDGDGEQQEEEEHVSVRIEIHKTSYENSYYFSQLWALNF
jgi:hypothetical protein